MSELVRFFRVAREAEQDGSAPRRAGLAKRAASPKLPAKPPTEDTHAGTTMFSTRRPPAPSDTDWKEF